jgi:DNA modification methylase
MISEERLIFREQVTDRKRTDYLTHGLFPYPARFIPQIPRYFIKEYMHNHHALLDPFCGSGTSLVEARVLGYSSYGIELNPLGRLLTRVKTAPVDTAALAASVRGLTAYLTDESVDPVIPDFPNRDFWFSPPVQDKLGRLRAYIDGGRNQAVKQLLQVCLVGIVRRCSNADPRISKPVFTRRMQATVKSRHIDPYALFQDRVKKVNERVVTLTNFLEHDEAKATVIGEDARKIALPDEAVHLVVTSPPFVNAQEYFRVTKFEIWWAGLANVQEVHDLEKRMIGVERVSKAEAADLHLLDRKGSTRIDRAIRAIYAKDKGRAYVLYQYFSEMETVFREVRRVLDAEGRFAITIGDNVIRKVPIDTHGLIIDLAESVGFETERVAYDIIKTHALATKRNVTAGLMTREWAMVFAKAPLGSSRRTPS